MQLSYRSKIGLAFITFLFAALHASANTSAQESFSGVWKAEHTFSHSPESEIIIRKSADQYFAIIDTLLVKFAAPTDESPDIRFTLPDKNGSAIKGEFRGHLDSNQQSISGHWIFPIVNPITNYPVAVPLAFETTEQHTWQATIPANPDKLTFFLCVNEDEEGKQTAFIRNPERNFGIRLGYFDVSIVKNKVSLSNPDRDLVIPGMLDSKGKNKFFSCMFPGSNVQLQFQKLNNPESDVAFAPNTDSTPYEYRVPEQVEGGWESDRAENQGMDPSRLTDMVNSIRETETDSLTAPYIHSVLIARNEKIVLEEYFHGFDREHLHDTRSAGKSVASMIIGTAIDRSKALSLDTTVSSVFGDRFEESNKTSDQANDATNKDDDPSWTQRSKWRSQMTIGNALGMQSGLSIDDDNYESPGSEDRMQNQTEQGNWVDFVFNVPMIRKPGTQAIYGSNNINLAAATIAESTRTWLPDLFHQNLAAPLGIDNYRFNLDPSGNGYMGGGIRLRPRDQLKLGQVMLGHGTWKNKRILSEAWVAQSLTPSGSIHEPNDYCYGWWKKSLPLGDDKTVDVWHASGNGGQFIVIVPDLDLVIQVSGGNYSNFPVWYKHLTEMIPTYVFAAIND